MRVAGGGRRLATALVRGIVVCGGFCALPCYVVIVGNPYWALIFRG